MVRSKFLGAIAALPLLAIAASSAHANIIALVIDSSGSIEDSDYELQKDGYISALTDLLEPNGQNSIGVWQFDNHVVQEFAIRQIASQSDKDDLLDAIAGMTQLGNDTAIGDAINVAADAITTFNGAGSWIIDVSTDGRSNRGVDPAGAASDAFANGIAVNCLGIGHSADCDFNDGFGVVFTAATFDDFEAAIRTKLGRELDVPEPATLALFGFGLLGLGRMRRRKP